MTAACPTHPGTRCTKPPNTRQTCCLPRTAPNATSRPPTHPLQGMQWEIAAPTTAVLTGMPSHTLSRQRGMMWWPMDLLWGRNAQPRVGWMPQGLQMGPLWHPPARARSAKPGCKPGCCHLGELPRGDAGQAEAQLRLRGPARLGAPSLHGVSLRVQCQQLHSTPGAGHPSSPLLPPAPECPQATAFIN